MSMNRVVRMAGVLATGVGIAVLGGCAGAEGGGADEPLANYLGYSPLADEHERTLLSAKSNEWSDEEKKRRRAIEDLVASCMGDKGFEYVPTYPEFWENQPPSQLDLQASMSPEEFAERYGYGETTLYYNQKATPSDPNRVIYDGLSPEAQKAYSNAEWGDDGAGGCRREADKEVSGDANAEELQIVDEFKGLSEDISQLHRRLADDPRLRDAARKWADCLADGGYPGLEQFADARNLVAERAAPILRDENGNSREQVDQKMLKEVQDFERAVATADFACTEKHVAPVREEVAARLEKQFVAEHKAELERFRDRASGYSILLGFDT